ncbi:hypothetical protein LMG7974_00209 [Campylobacter majalis]|uniref:Restriction endonuclease type IV Mrr domain-containing protein n=1 Tax=Campylobacter majalis TaxID=2790656 RepID=A0ABN7K412_9BACT|nr:restriction endonuclease [Campylobacter majalis]CAD7287268.1 hypothetical protein LMG7974_00209 [Campylobacter majalis]
MLKKIIDLLKPKNEKTNNNNLLSGSIDTKNIDKQWLEKNTNKENTSISNQENSTKKQLSQQEKIKKGKEYEYFIKIYFENLNYKVYPNGYIKGVKDSGIDLIAYKDNEAILIQCKNWKNPPKQKDLKIFLIDCDLYIQKNNKILKNKDIKKFFITSCEKMDYGVECYLKEYNNLQETKIHYKIIPKV